MAFHKNMTDEAYQERVRRARAMSGEEKLMMGPRLFDQACRTLEEGIRILCPYANEQRVHQILVEMLGVVHRMEDGDCYQPLPTTSPDTTADRPLVVVEDAIPDTRP